MRPSTLLASLTFRNVGPAVVPLTGLLVGGCVDSLGNDGAADTDSPPDQFSGVKVGCQNLPDDAGADETGADAGQAVGENWWWRIHTGMAPQTYQICGPNVTDDICCTVGATMCWEKEYAEFASEPIGGGIGRICVTPEYTGGDVEPLTDWVDGEYPTIDGALRAECSVACEAKPDPYGLPVACAPEDCDLDDDCADWFYPSVAPWVLHAGEAAIIDPETRTAHYLGVDDVGSQLAIDMSGSGAGIETPSRCSGWPSTLRSRAMMTCARSTLRTSAPTTPRTRGTSAWPHRSVAC